MKTIHKIRLWLLRRKLIRQRAENIRAIKAGKWATKLIKRDIARVARKAGIPRKRTEAAAIVPKATACGASITNISSVLSGISFAQRKAA